MRTIVFLGAKRSGSSRDAISVAAGELGLFTVLITDRRSLLRDRAEFPEVHRMIYSNLSDVSAISSTIDSLISNGHTIEAIVSFVDPLVSVAALLSQQFCKGNPLSLSAILSMEDKIKTRKALEDTPFNPFYTILRPKQTLESCIRRTKERLPVVIKTPDSTGSRDVRRALSSEQLEQRLGIFRSRFPRQRLLIEEYLKGPQYLVEVLVENGVVKPIAIIQQHMLNHRGFMIVDGYGVLIESTAEFYDNLTRAVKAIIECLGITNGACHLELRQAQDGRWKLIEINPRISGGAMNRIIEISYGINLVYQTLKLYLGETPDLTPMRRRHVYAKYITSGESGVLHKVLGKHAATRVPGVEEVFIKPHKGQKIHRPESMGHRYAYVIAADDNSLEVAKAAAIRAAEQIHFELRSE